TGLKIGFITERQLESAEVPRAPVLFVAGVVHISDAAAASLRKYKGRLVFVSDCDLLTHDEYGRLRSSPIRAERVPLVPATAARDLHRIILQKLAAWNVHPDVEVRQADGRQAWGIECRAAPTP